MTFVLLVLGGLEYLMVAFVLRVGFDSMRPTDSSVPGWQYDVGAALWPIFVPLCVIGAIRQALRRGD